ncbi:MAG: glycogen synthase GlgA [Puniceicoccaceae bacterium]
MKVLMATPEVVPLMKEGGLADVVGSLSKVLHARGEDVRIVLPKYASLDLVTVAKPLEGILYVHLGETTLYARLWETVLEPDSPVPVYLVEFSEYFDRPGIYHNGHESYGDNAYRFAFFSRAVVDVCHRIGWYPDVVHCHDWPTGMLPVILNEQEAVGPMEKAVSVYTIHNLEHQGYGPPDILSFLGLPGSLFRPDGVEAMGRVNMMKGGIYHANKVTTVSPRYAREIRSYPGGCGLEHVLQFKGADLLGILNGIDEDEWNPATDELIEAKFDLKNLSGKEKNRTALREYFSLRDAEEMPIFGVVSRLYHQKGLDLLLGCLEEVLEKMMVQFVVLGNGERFLEDGFRHLAGRYPERLGVQIGFNTRVAHQIFAGSDFFVMPSRFEPCGLGQMYAMRYGSLPVARRTGGLADTVLPYDEETGEGNGFLFEWPGVETLRDLIGMAVATWYDRPAHYRKLQRRAMKTDFGWGKRVDSYLDVYRWAAASRGVILEG